MGKRGSKIRQKCSKTGQKWLKKAHKMYFSSGAERQKCPFFVVKRQNGVLNNMKILRVAYRKCIYIQFRFSRVFRVF